MDQSINLIQSLKDYVRNQFVIINLEIALDQGSTDRQVRYLKKILGPRPVRSNFLVRGSLP